MVQRKSVRGSARVRVTERTSAASISREDRVVVEEPLEIRLAAPGSRCHSCDGDYAHARP
ncbi:MAG: hypothetical protein V9E81_01540 [Marmoricola sp.]